MTLAEMRTEVFRRLNESSSSGVPWTAADVDDAINDGYEEISDASEWYERSANVPLLHNQAYYDLRTNLGDDTMLSPGRCLNVQTNRWMIPTQVREMDNHTYRRWETISTGAPERIFQRGLWWLGTFPKSSVDSGVIRFFYTAIPPLLEHDWDEPTFPKEFHYGLVEYAIGDLFGQDGETKKALGWYAKYQQKEAGLTAFVQGRERVDRIYALHG